MYVDVAAAGAAPLAVNDGVAANHLPPTPWPLVCPAAVSAAYVCSGQPLYVTSIEPSDNATVPSVPVTLEEFVAAPLALSGGHVAAHPPVQATTPPFSGVK